MSRITIIGNKRKIFVLIQEKKLRGSFTYYSQLFARNIPKHGVLLPPKSQPATEPRCRGQIFEENGAKTNGEKYNKVKQKKNLGCFYTATPEERLRLAHTQPAADLVAV